MKMRFIACSISAILSGGVATAQDLSFSGDIGFGLLHNADGGSGIDSNGGINGSFSRDSTRINLSVGKEFVSFIGQVDLRYAGFGAPTDGDQDDSTRFYTDVTLRAMRDFGANRLGVFAGYGIDNDTGDGDEPQYYQYIGIDGSTALAGGEAFGQLGYLDSADEYDEGTQHAPFVRVGMTYPLGEKLSVTGAVSLAGGRKYGDSFYKNRIRGLELGADYAINDSGLKAFANLEWTEISYQDSGDRYGDTFQTVTVGVKFDLGAKTRHAAKLPNFGQWVAFNSNEVE